MIGSLHRHRLKSYSICTGQIRAFLRPGLLNTSSVPLIADNEFAGHDAYVSVANSSNEEEEEEESVHGATSTWVCLVMAQQQQNVIS